ncbi:S9 family peptidase [Melioribacteraceae bacterium 4301-Me]|uniref:S9 family peptidase n=1 Tax=Pyranulibacter aquaticus TaxID=3163344 RepID=UPI0035996A03
MKIFRNFLLLLITLLYIQSLAQTQDSTKLSLDRLFKSPEFFGERFGPARFIDNGSSYTTLEPSEEVKNSQDIVKYDTKTGKREVLVSAKLLIPEGDTTALSISNYEWSPNHEMLLIFTNTARVWRYNTRGDYWVLNLKTNKLMKLGGNAPESSLMFAKFSPDNKKVAYVSEHNIFVQDLSDGKITQLTFDGSKTIINGTFDWVYEEELDDRDGFRWSPDSKSIAYWQLDASGVKDFLLINDTDSLYSFVKSVQYPKVGTTNSACKVGVVSAEGGETVWMKVPGDPRNNYIARMDWTESSDEIYVQQLNRLQNKLEVMLCNIHTGDVRTILTETDKAWVDVNDDMHWFNKGKEFTWVSERDGWRHIYSVSRDGANVKLLTPGNFDVIEIVSVDFSNGWIYYIASPDNATQRYLYRVSLDGSGKIEMLTPSNEKGTHSYQIADGARFAIHNYSTANTPPITDLIELPSHKVIRTLVNNEKLKEKVGVLNISPMEFFKVDIGDNVILDGWIIKPPDFDSSKKYPVLFYVYTEPAAQTVLDRWSGTQYLWFQMLAQKGYIVISVDNRGTPAPRGREWRKSIYKKIGVLNSHDQAEAAKALIKKWSFIDSERIGVWGWSGGGSATLQLMFRYPEIYKTGMSVAPVTDEKLYDTIYEERYMGLPEGENDAYEQGSAIHFAKNLKGNLLIVHGSGDDNVHYQNTERLVNELVKYNKQFSLMVYPNRTHGIYEGPGTRLHLYTLLTNYLEKNLQAGAK